MEIYENDNKLITLKDLKPPIVRTLWSDENLINQLNKEMEILSNIRFPPESYPEEIIVQAMADVFTKLQWNDYDSFRETISHIIRDPRSVPFSVRTKDALTGKNDFWIQRVFINDNNYKSYSGELFPKKEVLLSRQFTKLMRTLCKTVYKDEVQFWCFTGNYQNNQKLDLSKLKPNELILLSETNGNTDPNTLIMFQFKKKIPEVIITV
jgi:hypothetical protein